MKKNKSIKFPYISENVKNMFCKTLSFSRYERQILKFERILNSKKKTKVLEIGGGEGITLAILDMNGYDAYSIEPKKKYVKHAQILLKENGIDVKKIKQGYSEQIPFPDDFFDYVISYQVIEHVNDVIKTFKEVERVLKPGGETLHICPNYHSFYEGHYKVLMLPFMSKKIFKVYIYLLKKLFFWKHFADISYVDGLNFVTADVIEDISSKHLKDLFISDRASEILNREKGNRTYKKRILYGNDELLASRIMKKFVIMLAKIRLADFVLNWLIRRGYFTHLYIVGKKAKRS